MASQIREKSSTDIYHVVLRGINKQVIFEDEEDFRKFLFILSDCKETCEFQLYAYCLMSNHIHLLIRTGKEPLGKIFQKLECSFVHWYNKKYERCGHLFQNRFKSIPVQSKEAFLTVLRYILQNPMKAGIENVPGSYPWSSYFSYAGPADGLTDIGPVLRLFTSTDEMLSFLCQKNDDCGLEANENRYYVTDEKASEIMYSVTGCSSVSEFQKFEKPVQKKYAAELKKHHLSLNLIVRITGMSKTTVYRATRK